MQQAVGAAAGRHHIAHDVFKAGLAQDVAGANLMLPGVHNLPGSLPCQLVPFFGLAAGAGVVVRGKSQNFRHGAHRLGGTHKGQAPGWGRRGAQRPCTLAGDGALHAGGVGLLGVGQGDHTPVRAMPCCHIAACEHHGGDIHAHGTHQHTGNDLVAGRHNDHTFEHIQVGDHLHLAGNQIAGGQGVAVAGGVAADAVADAADGQFQRQTAQLVDLLLHLGNQCLVKG